MTVLALPTRKQESWRYADMDALAGLWPLPEPEHVVVPAGEFFTRLIVPGSGGVMQLHLTLQKNARAHVGIVNITGDYARVEIHAELHDGADFQMAGVMLGGGEQTLEIITLVHHLEPGATSQQVVRSLLAERAMASYLGKIEVAASAQKTDASQSSKAMLLARTATMNTKPELIIHADDVKCAHGATVGELDKQALFYMQTRGLDPAKAKALLIEAFFADTLALMPNDDMHADLTATISAKLQQLLQAGAR
jgi:Fe-S cluster assembly protein SufD